MESSTFGSEFVALRICVEIIEALRYKLRMFGIPIDGPANTFLIINLLSPMPAYQHLPLRRNLMQLHITE
jgi:hypothetical protein